MSQKINVRRFIVMDQILVRIPERKYHQDHRVDRNGVRQTRIIRLELLLAICLVEMVMVLEWRVLALVLGCFRLGYLVAVSHSAVTKTTTITTILKQDGTDLHL